MIECLSSIIKQQDKNFEIIAIDDGSTDGSYLVAAEYLRENLTTKHWKLTRRENHGINKTINEAIQNSSGEIIFILASDDRMIDGALTKVREAYLNESNRCKLFFYDNSLIDWLGQPVNPSVSRSRRGGPSLLAKSKLHLAAQIILNWGWPFANQFYSREYYNLYGPYPEHFKYEDLYFALKSIVNDKFTFVPVILKDYRLRKDQTHTPGLTLADLDQSEIRSNFERSTRFRYTILLFASRQYYSSRLTLSKYIFGKFMGFMHRSISYWCNLLNMLWRR